MDWTGSFDFRMPSQIAFGVGSVRRVGEIALGLGGKNALVLTDPAVYERGLTSDAEKSLKDAGLGMEIFSGVATEPTLESVEKAVEAFRAASCDLIVALGGGSTIDSAKSVSLLIGNEGRLQDYQQRRIGSDWSPSRKVQRRGAHVIAIPTTAGTGSEVTTGSGVFDPETGIKGWAGDPLLRPTVAICDPQLHVSMPPRVTADTGTDALSQAMECYLVKRFKPTSETLALKAIEVIGKYLPRAFANGEDVEARSAMAWAATTVGLAFSNGGLIHNHTYSEVLGDITHLPHGRLLGITLPHILEFNLMGCEDKLGEVGFALGEKADGLTRRGAAEQALTAVRRLLADIEITDRLSDHGVTEEQLEVAADRIFAQHEARSTISPRGFRTRDQVVEILRKVY